MLYNKDFKYLFAYLLPLSAFLGLYYQGYWSFGAVYLGFILLPAIELFTPNSAANHRAEEEPDLLSVRMFDVLLYLNLPILYALLAYYFYLISHQSLSTFEYIGLTANMGLTAGVIGINVGHELGHRTEKYEQVIAQLLLLPSLYMHFFIEHNLGHHKHVSTDEDPASSRFGENIYFFWVRSVTGVYRKAWQIENELVARKGQAWYQNRMIHYQLIQGIYLTSIFAVFGLQALWFAIAVAIGGFLMLESVNYIEHYGLRRKKLPSGRYERVMPCHSWNSDHEMGRIFLYELTRHSDHHYLANRKYQILRHQEESPQLPLGYPGSILMAMFPPIWFRVMNPRVKAWQNRMAGAPV